MRYEFAATMEGGTPYPYIVGTYSPRRYDNNLKFASGSAESGRTYIYNLSDPADAGKFYV
jgi:hypothetical protein